MHVLMFHARYRAGGGEDISAELEAEHLRRAGLQVTQVVAPALGYGGTWWPAWWGRRVARMMSQTRFDLLHVQNFFPAATTSVHRAAFDHGIPVVQHIRNGRLLCPAGTLWRGDGLCLDCRKSSLPGIRRGCWRNSQTQTLLSSYAVRWQQDVWDRVSAFVTPSAFLRNSLAAVLDPRRVSVVPNLAPELVPAPNAQRRGIVYAGRLSPEKGVEIFLQAIKAIDSDVPVTVYGAGPLEERVRACGRVRMCGHVPVAEVYRAMERAKVVVVPSLWPEPFGRTALEGMAAGAAVVASAVGGLPDVLGPIGLLVPPGNSDALASAIQGALDNSIALGDAGCRRARTLFGTINPLLEVYRRCIRIRKRS